MRPGTHQLPAVSYRRDSRGSRQTFPIWQSRLSRWQAAFECAQLCARPTDLICLLESFRQAEYFESSGPFGRGNPISSPACSLRTCECFLPLPSVALAGKQHGQRQKALSCLQQPHSWHMLFSPPQEGSNHVAQIEVSRPCHGVLDVSDMPNGLKRDWLRGIRFPALRDSCARDASRLAFRRSTCGNRQNYRRMCGLGVT